MKIFFRFTLLATCLVGILVNCPAVNAQAPPASPSGSKMPSIVGQYRKSEAGNYGECLQALGAGFILRKLASSSTPVLEVSGEGTSWTFKTSTTFQTLELKFKLDVEFEEMTLDGRDVNCVVRREGDTFVFAETAKMEGQKSTEVRRQFLEDKVVVTMKVLETDVVCVQEFQRL